MFFENIEDRFSFKAFAYGIIFVTTLYIFLFLYAALKKNDTLKTLESRLSSQTVLIDNHGIAFPETAIEIQSEESLADYGENETRDGVGDNDLAKTIVADASPEASDKAFFVQQGKSLREAPVPGFYEDSSSGQIPVAKSKVQTPFSIYKKPFVLKTDHPHVAFVMMDFGLSTEHSNAMIEELPAEVSFVLSPYSFEPERWVKKARKDGHEVWLHLPLENDSFPGNDPGAKALLTRVSLQYNQERTEWLLTRSVGYAGVVAFSDSILKNAGPMFDNISREIFDRGLGYLELNPDQKASFVIPIAQEEAAPWVQNTLSIDAVSYDGDVYDTIRSYFGESLKNQAIVTVYPSSRNIQNVKKWFEALSSQNIAGVPVSSIAEANTKERE